MIAAARVLLATSRPRFWLYLGGPAIVGAVYGAESLTALSSRPALLLIAYFLIPANVFLYGVNDIFDARIDRENPKKRAGPERRFSGEGTVVAGTATGLVLGIGMLPFLPPASVPWILGFLLLGTVYSTPPLRLKTTPFFDSLSNGLYILPGVAAYVALAGTLPPIAAIVGGWCWTMAMHTYSAIPDIEPDRRAGITTTATRLGRDGAVGYCTFWWAVAALAFGVLDWRAGALLGVYPVAMLVTSIRSISIARAYWWYPWINAAVGFALTVAGLWRFLNA